MRMRNRHGRESGGRAEVILTPLIDCVFLLIVFFLVTSMFKRFERQIPINLAESSASVAETAHEEALLLGINTRGHLFQESHRNPRGHVQFVPVPNPGEFFSTLASEKGLDQPIELIVERETPFQTVIKTIDLMELQGFRNVRSRVRAGNL